MNNKKISIIVPVYNSEQYLDECINSIRNQSYRNLEIVLVDDGSFDKSGEMCDMYASLDDRVKVIHQQNSGPGAARNAGIDVAEGDYIAFVDSDDTISEEMYESLLSLAEEYNADIVCSVLEQSCNLDEIRILDRKEALLARLKEHIISDSSCDKVYKKSVFVGNRYPNDRSLSEDSALIYRLIASSKRVVITNKSYYFIRRTEGSLSRRKYSPNFRFTIRTYEEMVEYFKSSGDEDLVVIAQEYSAGAIFFNAGEYYASGCKDIATKKYIKDHARRQLCSNNKLSMKKRFQLWLVANVFWLFGKIYSIKKVK